MLSNEIVFPSCVDPTVSGLVPCEPASQLLNGLRSRSASHPVPTSSERGVLLSLRLFTLVQRGESFRSDGCSRPSLTFNAIYDRWFPGGRAAGPRLATGGVV